MATQERGRWKVYINLQMPLSSFLRRVQPYKQSHRKRKKSKELASGMEAESY
jgi:hypothetical protein